MNIFKSFLLLLAFATVSCVTSPDSSTSKDSSESSVKDNAMEFMFPLNKYKRVSRGYNGKHKGVDVSAPKGTPIFASESGWVLYQGRRFKGYGNLVIVEHSKSWATFYAHMNKFEAQQGAWVNKGDIIGYVGNTGRSTAPHLHFEVRFKNVAIDPMPYFNSSELKYALDDHSGPSSLDHFHD